MGARLRFDDASPFEGLQALLLAGLLVVSAAAVGIGVASAPAVAQDDATAAFDGNAQASAPVGDIIGPYTIVFSGTDTATVVLQSPDPGNYSYWFNATLTDTDGDGTVNFSVNSFALGHTDDALMVSGGEVTSFEYEELPNFEAVPKSEDSAPYDLHVGSGSDPSAVLSDPTETASFHLDEAEGGGFDPVTAPRGAVIDDITDVYPATRPSSLRPGLWPVYADARMGLSVEGDRAVARGDTLVMLPSAGGITGPTAYAMDHSNSSGEALMWLLENDYFNFSVRTVLPPEGQQAKVLDIERALEDGALTFAGGMNGTDNYRHIVFALDTGAAVWQRGGSGDYITLAPGNRVEFTFSRHLRAWDLEHSRNFTTNVSVLRPTLNIQSTVRTFGEGKIGGKTTLAPGTALTVYVQPEGGDLHTFSTVVKKTAGGNHTHYKGTSNIEEHVWNFTAADELPSDVNAASIQVGVSSEAWGTLAAEPPNYWPESITTVPPPTGLPTTEEPGGDTTDAPDGDTTDAPDDETSEDPAETTTDGGDDGDSGGTIPGFTAPIALLAVVAAALLALRRD